MSDLVEKLRSWPFESGDPINAETSFALVKQAAVEIETLRLQLVKKNECLTSIAATCLHAETEQGVRKIQSSDGPESSAEKKRNPDPTASSLQQGLATSSNPKGSDAAAVVKPEMTAGTVHPACVSSGPSETEQGVREALLRARPIVHDLATSSRDPEYKETLKQIDTALATPLPSEGAVAWMRDWIDNEGAEATEFCDKTDRAAYPVFRRPPPSSSPSVREDGTIASVLTERTISTPAAEQVWRPIESAPKDGSSVLSAMDGGYDGPFWVIYWNGKFFECVATGDRIINANYWMTIPRAPEDSLVLKKDEQSEPVSSPQRALSGEKQEGELTTDRAGDAAERCETVEQDAKSTQPIG